MKTTETNAIADSTPTRNQNQRNSELKPINTKTKHATSIKGMLRSWKAGKRGVYVRVTINREQEYYPTGYYVDESSFDIGAGLIKGNAHNKEEINSYLRYLMNELDGVLSTLKRSDDVLSMDNFRRYYSRRVKRDMRFDDYFKAALAEKKQNIEPATVELYTRLLTNTHRASCRHCNDLFMQLAGNKKSGRAVRVLFEIKDDKIRYVYDMGDDWAHDIEMRGIVREDTLRIPRSVPVVTGPARLRLYPYQFFRLSYKKLYPYVSP